MREKCFCLLIGLAAMTGVQYLWCENTPATETRNIIATFAFDGKTESRPPAFIFVNKKLAGAMPGTVALPDEGKPVAIEIGIPRLGPNPVYSLAVGPKDLAQKSAEIVISHYSVIEVYSETGRVSPKLTLDPNTKQNVAIEEDSGGIYKFVIPAKPYHDATAALSQQAAMKAQYGRVKSANDKSDENAIWHYSYSLSKAKVVPLIMRRDETWSDAPAVDVFYWLNFGSGQIGYGGLPVPHEEWTVISNPPGATIMTERGAQGPTTSTVEMPVTGNPYLVLQKENYVDCSYDHCLSRKTAKGKIVTCNLTKLGQKTSP